MLKTIFKQYKKNEDGNIAVMFVGSFLMLYLLVGTAVDVSMMHRSQAKLQDLTDAAALATLKFGGDTDDREAFFIEYVNLLSEQSNNSGPVTSKELIIQETDTAITLQAKVSTPHKLVLLDHFFNFDHVVATTNVEIGIDHYEIALAIDISSSMAGARLREAKASTELFVEQLLSDASLTDRVSISLVPFGGTVRVPEELDTLLETPSEGLEEFSNYWIGGEWNQCFEYELSDISNGIDLDATYAATPDFWSWNKTNPWCPLAGNEFVPLTDDLDTLIAKVDTLSLSDGTGSDHGMRWAFETLNHDWENRLPGGLEDTPAAHTDRTKKVIVFMTDGGITQQHYLLDSFRTGQPPFNSKRKKLTSYSGSLNAFYSACDEAKDHDIEVYTIGYNLSTRRAEGELQNCATTTDHYIDASSGNLESVFAELADTISPLRLSN